MIELSKVIEGVVSSMRSKGTSTFTGGVTAVSNSFKNKEWVTINGKEYQVKAVSPSSFSVDSTLPDGDYEWIGMAPYFYWGTKKEILVRLADKDKGLNKKSQKYPMIALQPKFEVEGYTTPGGETLSIEEDGVGKASGVSILFIADSKRDNNLPYDNRLDNIITPQLTPLVKLFKAKLDFFKQVAYAETQKIRTIPNFGTESSQGKEKLVTLDPWEVKEGIYDITLLECCTETLTI